MAKVTGTTTTTTTTTITSTATTYFPCFVLLLLLRRPPLNHAGSADSAGRLEEVESHAGPAAMRQKEGLGT